MANQIDETIQNTIIADTLSNVLNPNTLPLRAFSTDISGKYAEAGDIVRVPFVDSVGDPIFNTTDWEQSDVTKSKKDVRLVRITRTAGLDDKNLRDGHRFGELMRPLSNVMANGVLLLTERAMAGAAKQNIGAASLFDHSVLNEKVWPTIKKGGERPSVYLATEYFARLLKVDNQSLGTQSSAFDMIGNYDGVGTSANFVGMALHNAAFLLANRLPHEAEEDESKDYSKAITVEIPEIGLQVLYTEWTVKKTRQRFCSLDTLVGIERGAEANALLLMNDDGEYVAKKLQNVDTASA